MSDNAAIGKRVRALRMERGLTQEELSKLLGYTSRSSINKIECGKNAVQSDMISEFARVLQTTPAYLLGTLESGLKALNVDVLQTEDGSVLLHDTLRHVRVQVAGDLWRSLEEEDAFDTVWGLVGAADPNRVALITKLDTTKTPTPVTEDKRSQVQILFDQLSPANQSKLLELAHLYLAGQSKTEET